MNRLRTYLSWKDVRKNAKEDGGGGGAGEVDLNAAVEDVDMAKAQGGMSRKLRVKLPWEISAVYSDYVVPGAIAAAATSDDAVLLNESDAAAAKLQQQQQAAAAAEEELDDDDQEAMRESLKRLKEADDATLRMTREEYEHYSECRAASFTFRKAKKFRDFISSSTYLDVRPNDDIVDVLGFLAFEVVREITLGAKAAWEQERSIELQRQAVKEQSQQEELQRKKGKRKRNSTSSLQDDEGQEEVGRQSGDSGKRAESDPRSSQLNKGSPHKSDETAPESAPPADAKEVEGIGRSATTEGTSVSVTDLTLLYPESQLKLHPDEHLPDGASFCGLFGLGPVQQNQDDASAAPKVKESSRTEAAKVGSSHINDQNADGEKKGNGDAATDENKQAVAEPQNTATAEDKVNEDSLEGSEEEESPALLPHHIREAFARLQREKTKPALSAGTKNVGRGPMGGLRRTRMWVI